jgi:branched-chain amino acid transport system ATP-binding protein
VTLLAAEGLRAAYGAATALHGVDLALDAGQALALTGRNGMGKTTLVGALTGLVRRAGGTVTLAGARVEAWPPHRIARLGVGLVPEGRRVFPTLTVAETLRVAARPGPWDADAVERLFPRLAERRGHAAGKLSGGEQQMLAIGRALTTNPRLLILDEATEGLAPLIRAEIWAALARLRAEGMALLVVDRDLDALARLADRHLVLEGGRVAWSGGRADLAAARDTVRALLTV